MSQIVDPKVIERIEQRGFRRDPADPLEKGWFDEHGHMLTELQLAAQTPESVDELIDGFHRA